MPVDPKSIGPTQRSQFLDFLQMLGGPAAVNAGLDAFAKLDKGQQLPPAPPVTKSISIEIPKDLLAGATEGVSASGIPWGDIWKYGLKIVECGLKNIELALKHDWPGFVAAVIACAFSS